MPCWDGHCAKGRIAASLQEMEVLPLGHMEVGGRAVVMSFPEAVWTRSKGQLDVVATTESA